MLRDIHVHKSVILMLKNVISNDQTLDVQYWQFDREVFSVCFSDVVYFSNLYT